MFALLMLTMMGCFESPFEGTWLFMVNTQSEYSGDCASDSDVTYTGTSNMWVDIYKASNGEFVVLMDQPLVGEPDGNALTATWSYETSGDGYSDREVETLVANLKSGEIHGNVTTQVTQVSDGDTYSCETYTPFVASRTTSDPNQYLEQ